MATDNSNNAPGTQAEMDDILSSIRSTMAEEGAKVGSGSADLIEAAAAQDAGDDILDLNEADMVGGAASEDADELIDLDAFANSGEQKTVDPTNAAALAADILGEQAEIDEIANAAKEVAATPPTEADEFDRLLAEISQEQQQQVVASEISKQALMDEEEPLGGAEAEVSVDSSEIEVTQPDVEAVADAVTEELVASAVAGPVASPAVGGKASFTLGSVEGPEGVQIAFPAEVLAMALRPMVQDWLAKNLPAVVERLVKDEISKLTQN